MATTAHVPPFFDRLAQGVAAPFVALANGLEQMSRLSALSKEVDRLMNLTDDQLAARGLRREDVVRSVFAAYLGE